MCEKGRYRMQETEKLSREEIIKYYQEDAMKLLGFYNWLKKASGTDSAQFYKGDGIEESSMPVPVYDSTLLNFIKTAKTTKFMNRNYVYTFSRNNIKTTKDELRLIEECTLQDVKTLGDILSKYVLKGEVRGAIWSEGLKNGVYLAIVLKCKELLEIKKPLA